MVKLLTVLIIINFSSQALALRCANIFSQPLHHSKVINSQTKSNDEIIDYFKNFPDTGLSNRTAGVSLISQTAFITGHSPQKVIEFFQSFPETGYPRTDVTHNIIVQTAYLKKWSPERVMKAFEAASEVKPDNFSHLFAIAVQTHILTGKPLEVIVDFFIKEGPNVSGQRGFAQGLVLQTAFLYEVPTPTVSHFFRFYPYVGANFQAAGRAIIIQTSADLIKLN